MKKNLAYCSSAFGTNFYHGKGLKSKCCSANCSGSFFNIVYFVDQVEAISPNGLVRPENLHNQSLVSKCRKFAPAG